MEACSAGELVLPAACRKRPTSLLCSQSAPCFRLGQAADLSVLNLVIKLILFILFLQEGTTVLQLIVLLISDLSSASLYLTFGFAVKVSLVLTSMNQLVLTNLYDSII